MITLKNLTIKNFMSIGAVTQTINLNNNELTLILGENLDLGGNDSRNGVGKSTILNALSYALFGNSVSNIKKNNLINKTNGRGMLVTLDLQINDSRVRIERGRSPNLFKLLVNNTEVSVADDSDTDEAQGDSRQTQTELERLLGLNHNMFKNIVGLNTYSQPFLAMRNNEQREIIENLLGITKLSEKADALRELIRETKDKIKSEEIKNKAIQESNKQTELHRHEIAKKMNAWELNHKKNLNVLSEKIEELQNVNVEEEIAKHKIKHDIEQAYQKVQLLEKDLNSRKKDVARYETQCSKAKEEYDLILNHTCPTCTQSLMNHNDIAKMSLEMKDSIEDLESKIIAANQEIASITASISETSLQVPAGYSITSCVQTFYKDADQAYSHRSEIEKLSHELVTEYNLTNPFEDQLAGLKSIIKEVDFSKINELSTLLDHQEFLLKLLTNKDSFIRKRIIDQNLSFLNSRLSTFLEKLGLPHNVLFQSNLEVEITELGRDLDFDNLSRGERTRLILALSLAFRDVFESLNSPINLLFIDELIDNGLDTSGVEAAMSILKRINRDHSRSIYLISHRDELIGRVDSVVKVIKENGFTAIEKTDA